MVRHIGNILRYSTEIMSSVWAVRDFITISALAIKVHAAYEDAGEDYRHILEEIMTLLVLIDKAKQYLKSTTISSDDHQYGQKVLKGCKSALEDLNSLIEKCKRLASTHRRLVFTRFKLGNGDIESLQGRLISNIVLLKGFVRRFVGPGILLLSPMAINIPILVVSIERPKNSWLLFLVFTTQAPEFQ